MTKWNLIIDVARCTNCNNCVLALKDEYVGNDFPGYSAAHELHGPSPLKITRHVRGEGHLVDVTYVPRLCNHCDRPACLAAAGPGVVVKRPDGIVIIDPVAAVGRRDLVDACPYGAIVWNETAQLPQNWIFDAHLLDQGWKEPRCAHSCAAGAITAIALDDAAMARKARDEGLVVLSPELGTRPRVYYANYGRVASWFVGGTVVGRRNGVLDCIAGATATLRADGATIATGETDAFGDFKLDGIDRREGDLALEITHADFAPATRTVAAGGTVVLGEIELA